MTSRQTTELNRRQPSFVDDVSLETSMIPFDLGGEYPVDLQL